MSYSEPGFGSGSNLRLVDVRQLRMNPVVRDMWTAALRSGNYQQGRGRLVHTDSTGQRFFCCLGVLCDLAERAGIVSYDARVGVYRTVAVVPSGDEVVVDRATGALPEVVSRWAGLWTGDPLVSLSSGNRHHLSYTNDNVDDATFPVIADLIEASL